MANLVGKTLGRYRVVARLGRGGMAEVYKAYQPGLERYVAIKVLHAHLIEDEDFIGRFQREALAIGKLRHPNIVQALDFDLEGETRYMAMEYIGGPTLKDEIKARRNNKPFTLQEIARIFTALGSALSYAHARNMVHRDIKPANVMINEDGQIVLTDFGIARITGSTLTQTGALTGTPAYMSPEQGEGKRGDKRSDIYSLGIMLYEMVTGAVPYDADTPFAIILQHISEPLPLPTKVNPDISEAVEKVILKALSKNPDDRYQAASDMAQALREAVGLVPGDSLQTNPLKPIAPPPKIDQIDHPTGPITAEERAATAAVLAGGSRVTTVSDASGATTVSAPSAGLQILPLLIGGGILALIIVAGVVVFAVIGLPGGESEKATATAIAIAAVAETVEKQSEVTALETANAATAEFLAPTKTAEAVVTEAARTAATEAAQATRDAQLLGGFISTAQAATAEAQVATAEVATVQAATDEAMTAEAISKITPTPVPTETPAPTNTPPPALPTNTPLPAAPTDTPIPERPAISGKLAFPVDNGGGGYDVLVVSLPDGQKLGEIRGARQPNFRGDGVKLLVNGEQGGFGEDVWEVSSSGNIEKPVSSSPSDSHPVYNPDGNRLAYDNPQLAVGADGSYHSYLFVQCGMIPPAQDNDKCRNVAEFGILVPAGLTAEIQGSNPVWAADDHIFYKGCNTWAGGGSCGIFTVGSWATKQFSNGETPRKIVDGTSSTPTDTKGNLVAYHSNESGAWEAYIMDLSGAGIINISNSPNSSDGLPTISPNGQWVAFASDRDGAWAIYVAPSTGGQATKLFNFPKANPWGTGDRSWQNERISWGP